MPSWTIVELGAADDLAQRDRDVHFARHVRIVEFVGVAEPLVGRQLTYVPPKKWLWPVPKFVNDMR